MSEHTPKHKARASQAQHVAPDRSYRHRQFSLLDFEHKAEPLLPLRKFWPRLMRSVLWGVGLIGGSLLIGVVGYHWLGHVGWIDAILNASMILTGMGPVDRMDDNAAKLFASAYALFSGVAFLSSVGVLLAPIIHRFMHFFHIDSEAGDAS